MIHKYKEKCDVCGKWGKCYQSHKGKMIVCDKCVKEKQGRFELAEPIQITLAEALEGVLEDER